MKPIIHFTHGNGFPSSCYRQLLQSLADEYDVNVIEKVGHNPDFPVGENWHTLVDEVIESIVEQSHNPVVAVGHSLGGILSFLAAVQRPELIKAVVMIDSPVIGPIKSMLLKIAKKIRLIDKVTPAERTRGRRTHWPDKEHLLRYLKSKPVFQTFTDACLQDYIDYGLIKSNTGYDLAYDRQIEYLIYRTIPHMLPDYIGHLTCPCVMIYGNKSNVVDSFDLSHMRKQHGIRSVSMPGTHMLPFESPIELAKKIKLELEIMLS
ncbi:alpha/beta fold hydrolase [Legionella sp. W05-934-2]|jgi:pimeloyl-ACP methyl ester carboxylesterase|uniref:alpha/beta fold hydrolase n=1 Tax=Legionella sp. W05-934-2 TaxID=1198649 RepID=UPI003461D4EE